MTDIHDPIDAAIKAMDAVVNRHKTQVYPHEIEEAVLEVAPILTAAGAQKVCDRITHPGNRNAPAQMLRVYARLEVEHIRQQHNTSTEAPDCLDCLQAIAARGSDS